MLHIKWLFGHTRISQIGKFGHKYSLLRITHKRAFPKQAVKLVNNQQFCYRLRKCNVVSQVYVLNCVQQFHANFHVFLERLTT